MVQELLLSDAYMFIGKLLLFHLSLLLVSLNSTIVTPLSRAIFGTYKFRSEVLKNTSKLITFEVAFENYIIFNDSSR